MKYGEKRCKTCKKIFLVVGNRHNKYCSEKCSTIEHRLRAKIKKLKNKKPKIPRICRGCGKQFRFKKGGDRYCSLKCKNQFKEQERLEKIEMSKIIRECPICKKEFVITNINDIFCSKECSKKNKEEIYLKKWSERIPRKRKCQDLKGIMFHDLGDKPTDCSLKRFKACRG